MGLSSRSGAVSAPAQRTRATFVFLPFGQASPPHHKNGDCVIIQLQGTTEFTLADQQHRLAPHDCLVIPADEVYSYRNCGIVDSIFVGLIALGVDVAADQHLRRRVAVGAAGAAGESPRGAPREL